MLHYIEKTDLIKAYKQDHETSYIIDSINNITHKTDRSWLSTLEYDLVHILYENNNNKDLFYNDPFDFFNVVTNSQIRGLTNTYHEEVEYYYFNNVIKTDHSRVDPELSPDVEIFKDFPDRLYEYYFSNILCSVVEWLLS